MFLQTQALLFFCPCIQNVLAFPFRLKKLCPHSSVTTGWKEGHSLCFYFFRVENILQRLNRLPMLSFWFELDKGSPLNQSLTREWDYHLTFWPIMFDCRVGAPLPWEPCQLDKAGILLARKRVEMAIGQEIKCLVTLSLSFIIWQVGKTKLNTSLLWRSAKDKSSKKFRKDIFMCSLPCKVLNWL